MIPTVQLARSGLTTSRLAFGTSRLHYVDRQQRQRLLAAAADLGLVHLDTAPAYGDGLAEREVGDFIQGRRSRVIVATKYGIPPDPVLAALPALAPPLRVARAVARKVGLWRSTRPMLTPAGLRASAEASLRRMRTDRIDILLLHEPDGTRLSDPGALLEELHSLRTRGLIRHFGLAGPWPGIAGLAAALSDLGEIIQTGDAEWPADRLPDITYGAIARGAQSAFAAPVETTSAIVRLQAALRRRPHGVVIVSTRKSAHLARLAEAASAPPS